MMKLLLPNCKVAVTKVYTLIGKKPVAFSTAGADVIVQAPAMEAQSANTVLVLEYKGQRLLTMRRRP